MSDNIFREKEIQVDETTVILKKMPIDYIFQFGSQPYIITGTSGAGKTKLSMHLLYRYAKECTKVFYVSSTKSSSFNATDDDINRIPKVFRRSPSYDEIYGIWHDILEEYKAVNASIEDYEQVLLKIYGDEKEKAKSTIKYIREKCSEVYKEQKKIYTTQGQEEGDAERNARRDENAMKCSSLSILIVDGITQKGNQMLSEKELLTVNSLVSKKPKTLLILDDVTAEMEGLKSNGSRMVKYDGKPYKINVAYDLLITDILTRGRHYNCLIAIFLHDIKVVKPEQIKNVIVFDSASAQQIQLLRKIPKQFLKTLSMITPAVFNGEYKYYFIYGRPTENEVCVGKADLFSGPIEFSPANKALMHAYEEIARLNKEDDIEEDAGGEGGDEEVDEEEGEDEEEEEEEEEK